MVTYHHRTGTCHCIFANSNRAGYFGTICHFIFIISYKRKPLCSNYATLAKIQVIFFGADSTFATIRIFTIPGMRIRSNSNITAYVLSCNTIPNRNIGLITNGYVQIIRCRITSHRRSHACTGHNTCCNQHCQQLFRRAAFTAMIFRDFGDNNVCVARLTPNYFEYFVHQ